MQQIPKLFSLLYVVYCDDKKFNVSLNITIKWPRFHVFSLFCSEDGWETRLLTLKLLCRALKPAFLSGVVRARARALTRNTREAPLEFACARYAAKADASAHTDLTKWLTEWAATGDSEFVRNWFNKSGPRLINHLRLLGSLEPIEIDWWRD